MILMVMACHRVGTVLSRYVQPVLSGAHLPCT